MGSSFFSASVFLCATLGKTGMKWWQERGKAIKRRAISFLTIKKRCVFCGLGSFFSCFPPWLQSLNLTLVRKSALECIPIRVLTSLCLSSAGWENYPRLLQVLIVIEPIQEVESGGGCSACLHAFWRPLVPLRNYCGTKQQWVPVFGDAYLPYIWM
jgi:hypothetical protein